MQNIIIILILIIAVSTAIMPSVRHFKGRGGCCGGESYTPKKKKLDRVIGKKVFYVDGMHCENCSNRVMEAVNDIPGVSAKVNLNKGIVTVSYAVETADELIRQKIERAGYTVR